MRHLQLSSSRVFQFAMSLNPVRHFAVIAALLTVALPCFGADLSYRTLIVSDGRLINQGQPVFLRATDNEALFSGNLSYAERKRAYAKASDAGFTSFRMSLRGFNEDGTAIDPEYLAEMLELKEEIEGHWMPLVIDVLGGYPDASREFRRNAVKTAARALEKRRASVYLIDGADSEELANIFRENAPRLVVVAPEGGDIDVVKSVDEAGENEWPFVMGELPESRTSEYHTWVPSEEGTYEAHTKAVRRPIEDQPLPQTDAGLTDEEKADGFVSLFDGKTLKGWTIMGPNQEGFVVRDGAIRWNGRGGWALLSAHEYGDFVLRLQWKLERQGGNAGLFIRAPRANRMSRLGFEVQMMGDYGEEPTKHSTGAIYDEAAPRVNASNPVGEWNEYEITASGSKVTVKLNAVTIQDLDFDDDEELRYRKREGFIGLQDHSSRVGYRRIRIKELN